MPRTDTFLLQTGDYPQRLDALLARFEQAAEKQEKAAASRRLTDDSEVLAIQAEYEALKAEAEEAATRVTLEAMGRKEWRAIKVKHPPRTESSGVDTDTAKADRLAGVNTESVEDDLVYASLVEPKFESRAAYDEWADALSEGEFQLVLFRAWRLLNESRVDPKSLPALPTPSGDVSGR